MIRLRALAVWGILVCLAGLQCGCLLVAAAAGTGATVAYVRGDLETVVEGTPERIIAASRGAAMDMNLSVISSGASALDGEMIARTADDTKVTVNTKVQSDKMSTISIRVGLWGDRAVSQQVLDRIRARLKA